MSFFFCYKLLLKAHREKPLAQTLLQHLKGLNADKCRHHKKGIKGLKGLVLLLRYFSVVPSIAVSAVKMVKPVQLHIMSYYCKLKTCSFLFETFSKARFSQLCERQYLVNFLCNFSHPERCHSVCVYTQCALVPSCFLSRPSLMSLPHVLNGTHYVLDS